MMRNKNFSDERHFKWRAGVRRCWHVGTEVPYWIARIEHADVHVVLRHLGLDSHRLFIARRRQVESYWSGRMAAGRCDGRIHDSIIMWSLSGRVERDGADGDGNIEMRIFVCAGDLREDLQLVSRCQDATKVGVGWSKRRNRQREPNLSGTARAHANAENFLHRQALQADLLARRLADVLRVPLQRDLRSFDVNVRLVVHVDGNFNFLAWHVTGERNTGGHVERLRLEAAAVEVTDDLGLGRNVQRGRHQVQVLGFDDGERQAEFLVRFPWTIHHDLAAVPDVAVLAFDGRRKLSRKHAGERVSRGARLHFDCVGDGLIASKISRLVKIIFATRIGDRMAASSRA